MLGRKIIVVALVYSVVITSFFGIMFIMYWTGNLDIPNFGKMEPIPIKYVDEESRFSRPYTYISPISSSNVRTVDDFHIPKFFDNDNITVYFPEYGEYQYRIGLGSNNPSGSLIIYQSNGSELHTNEWRVSEGTLGGSLGGGFEGGGHLTLNFTGTGAIIFYSWSVSLMFEDSPDHSGTVEGGSTAFYLPWGLTRNTPDDRRILAKVSSDDGTYFHVRYYDDNLHFLGESKGIKRAETQIPSGGALFVFAVVESYGNVTLRFMYSEPLIGQINHWGQFLLGGFFITLGCMIILVLSYRRILFCRAPQLIPFNRVWNR